MKTRNSRLLAGLLIMVMLLATVSTAAGKSADNLAQRPGTVQGGGLFSASAIAGDVDLSAATVTRTRYVNVAFDQLGTLAAPAQRVELNLFSDAVFTANFQRTEVQLGHYVWVGTLEGIALSNATLVSKDGIMMGHIAMPGAVYEVRPAGNGVHAIQQINQAAFPEELPPIPAGGGGAGDAPAAAPNAPGAPTQNNCNEIMVLVAYSPEAATADGGTAAIEARAALAVSEANTSYANSSITNRMILVHTMQTSTGDAQNNFSADLAALQDLTDGVFDNVDAARETYYADVVGLIIENSSSCGQGYVGGGAAWAFTVTHRTCATGYYSFAHEIGHNEGALHDWFDDANTSPGYNKGYVNLANTWRTVMAYNDHCDCSDEVSPCPALASRVTPYVPSCTRIQWWSNPSVNYLGNPTGVAVGSPDNCVAGSYTPDPNTCEADNRTQLNNTCAAVALYRVWPTTVDLASFEAASQGNAVQIDWQTAAELETLGFNLYRAEAADGPRARLNGSLILAQASGMMGGASYTFTDETAGMGANYYWLEEVALSGEATFHGPIVVEHQPMRRLLPTRPRLAPLSPGLRSR